MPTPPWVPRTPSTPVPSLRSGSATKPLQAVRVYHTACIRRALPPSTSMVRPVNDNTHDTCSETWAAVLHGLVVLVDARFPLFASCTCFRRCPACRVVHRCPPCSSACLPACLPVCLPVCLCLSLCLCVCLSVCPSVCLYACMLISLCCLSACLPACHPTTLRAGRWRDADENTTWRLVTCNSNPIPNLWDGMAHHRLQQWQLSFLGWDGSLWGVHASSKWT